MIWGAVGPELTEIPTRHPHGPGLTTGMGTCAVSTALAELLERYRQEGQLEPRGARHTAGWFRAELVANDWR